MSASAERLHKLCDRRGRPRAEDHERRVAALARDMFEQLQVVRSHAMRLLDEPTADDAVDIDAEHRVMPPSWRPRVDGPRPRSTHQPGEGLP